MGWLNINGNWIGRHSGRSWQTYWTHLISAVVIDTSPKDVILTFGTANTSLTASDFAVAGTTVSSISRDATNKIIILTCADNVVGGATVTFNKTGDTTTVIKYLSRNADIVEIGGYVGIIEDDGTNIPSNSRNRSFLNQNNNTKVRINGLLSRIDVFIDTITNTTKLFLQIWRNSAGTYTLIYEEDVFTKIASRTVNSIILTTPVNVLEGDMIGFWCESSATDSVFEGMAASADSLPYVNGEKRTTGYDWDAALSRLAFVIPVKSYGQASLIIGIGDSIIAGHPFHDSYLENSKDDSKSGTITYQLSLLDSRYIYQNMGIGGQTSTNIKNRFTADVIDLKPKIAIIQGGVNDISKGDITKATFISNYTTMLNACETAGIIPVVLKILPWTNGTNDQMQDRDEWMTDLEALVATYAGSVWVDFDIDMGKFRVGGDADNLWDLQTDYDQDGVHPTLLGYTKMAEVIDREIKKKYDFS